MNESLLAARFAMSLLSTCDNKQRPSNVLHDLHTFEDPILALNYVSALPHLKNVIKDVDIIMNGRNEVGVRAPTQRLQHNNFYESVKEPGLVSFLNTQAANAT
ncbi:hypothetical protein KC19_2G089400 [Ceratodon purpureus]|uniref:Uncharacterized protein n=1 Tax=Ceratodon purpureus TaxID=3225 RepID=A0A8T0ITV4_CERPU|nr:hypothetical protein KC19_2G089400 [Ceratodon purpureus]